MADDTPRNAREASRASQPSRIAGVGLVDRSTEIGFRWNGRTLFGFSGDTLASALMANGVFDGCRSPRLNRRRGFDSTGPSPSGARIFLRRRGADADAFADPAQIELEPGLSASAPPTKLTASISPPKHVRDPLIDGGLFGACDVLVVGGGPAGLEAAVRLGEAGRDVLLTERDFLLGGRQLCDPVKIEGEDPQTWISERRAKLARAGVVAELRSEFLGLSADGAALLRVRTPGEPHLKIRKIIFARLILATGACESLGVFSGNDRPGVMSASALRAALFRYGVLPGRRIAIASSDDSGYLGVAALRNAGAGVMFLDMRAPGEARRAAGVAGVAHRIERAPLRTHGRLRLKRVDLAQRAKDGWADAKQSIETDILAVAGGWRPDLSAVRACGLASRWDDEQGVILAGEDAEAVTLAGAVSGLGDVNDCARSGRNVAARLLGEPEDDAGRFVATSAPTPLLAAEKRSDAFFNLSNDALRPESVEEPLSRQKPADALTELLSDRPAQRRSPAYNSLRRLGLEFQEQAGWLRPAHGLAHGDTDLDGPSREALAARDAIALSDLSHLTKLEISGPDAAALLDVACVKSAVKTPVGSARPTLLLNDEGAAAAEAVLMRLEDDLFWLTAQPEQGVSLMRRLQLLTQTRLTDMRTAIMDQTDAYACIAAIGPLARRALGRIVKGLELHDAAFPVGGVRTCRVGQISCRVARLSAAGELGYEIYAPAHAGEALFDALWDAARPMRGAICGSDALEILRIERGRIGKQELNDRATPADLGSAYLADVDRPFVGRVMAEAEDTGDAHSRPRLVSILPEDPSKRLSPGAALRRGPRTGPSLGWITSACWSEIQHTHIALGFIEGGFDGWGDQLLSADPPSGSSVPVRVRMANSFDPSGARARPSEDPLPPQTTETPRPAPSFLPTRTALGGLEQDPGALRSLDAGGVNVKEAPYLPHSRLTAWPHRSVEAEDWLLSRLGVAAPPAPGQSISNSDGVRVIRTGPLEWRFAAENAEAVALAPPPSAGLSTDMTPGLLQVELSGPRVRDLLARLVQLDLRKHAFPQDAAATIPFGGAPALMCRTGPSIYSIWLRRSAAFWCWERIAAAAARH